MSRNDLMPSSMLKCNFNCSFHTTFPKILYNVDRSLQYQTINFTHIFVSCTPLTISI